MEAEVPDRYKAAGYDNNYVGTEPTYLTITLLSFFFIILGQPSLAPVIFAACYQKIEEKWCST